MTIDGRRKTGRLAELEVESLFTSWGWVVGHDQIDDGYDLFVEPDRARFKGARFLVQVKGTAAIRKGRAITAPMAKRRLRDYAVNPIPVVIVRATGDGTLLWIHAQEWTRQNAHRLTEDGESGVRFDPAQKLSDQTRFQAFLQRVLSPFAERTGSLVELSELRSRHLNSLDPRFRVRVGVQGGAESYEVMAAGTESAAEFSFKAVGGEENIFSLREALDFGVGREVQVEGFHISGSPLFEAIGASEPKRGKIFIASANKETGIAHLRAGRSFSMLAPEFSVPVDLSRGHRGAAISSQQSDLLEVNVRIEPVDGRGKATFNMAFRDEALFGRPIRELTTLPALADLATEIIDQGVITVDLAFPSVKAPLVFASEEISSWPMLGLAQIFGKLHQVARALNSDLVVPREKAITPDDLSDLALAYALLKGDRREINVGEFVFEPDASLDFAGKGEFYITTVIEFGFLGEELGAIPVGISLPGFVAERLPDSREFRVYAGEHGNAWIEYSDHQQQDIAIRRLSV